MTNRRKRRWHKLPGALQSLIERLADGHPTWSPKQVYLELEQLYEEADLPELRTVQQIVKEHRPPDPSGAWVPRDWPGTNVALVLEVVRHLRQEGEHYWPSQAEADCILWVSQVSPTMPADVAWQIVRRFLLYEARQVSTERLGCYLAFRPWESTENKDAYFAAIHPDERVMYPVEASARLTGTRRVNVV